MADVEWVDEGELQALPDIAAAQLMDDDATRLAKATDRRVAPAVGAALAADDGLGDTIVSMVGTVAGAQVDSKIAAENLVRSVDPRLQTLGAAPGSARAGLDKIGVADALDLGEDGFFRQWVVDRILRSVSGITGDDMINVVGQSNGAKSGDRPVPAGVYEEDPNILLYEDGALVVMPATYSTAIAGLARERRRRYPNRRVIIVNGAVGSTAFSSTTVNPAPEGFAYGANTPTWTRTLTEDTQNLALRLNEWTKNVIAMRPSIRVAGIIYIGSEGDAGRRDYTQLAALLDDLFAWYRSEWSAPNAPVVLLQRVPEWERDRPSVGAEYMQETADAMESTGARIWRAAYARTPWGLANRPDLVHYAASSIEIRGKILADALDRARTNVSGPGWNPTSPQNVAVVRFGNDVTARWDHPPGPLKDRRFEVQTSIDAGTTWSTATLRHPLQSELKVTNSGRVRFRVRTLNPADATANSEYVYVEG